MAHERQGWPSRESLRVASRPQKLRVATLYNIFIVYVEVMWLSGESISSGSRWSRVGVLLRSHAFWNFFQVCIDLNQFQPFFLILLLLEKPNVRKQIIVFTVKNNTEAKKGNSENVVCIFVTLAKEIAALSA